MGRHCDAGDRPAALAQTLHSEDFALSLPLTTERDGLHALEIPEAVYRAAQTRSLTDMRILNARGEALPIGFLPAPPVQPRNAAAIDYVGCRCPLPRKRATRCYVCMR